MSNLDNIFDLPEGEKQEEVKEKKPRKKTEMSDEKKAAMLERLKAGREKRAENLKAKKAPAPVTKEEPKEVIISKKEKEVVKKTDNKQNKTDSYEDEKLSFIKMMAGKSKPIEKIERPKKKVYALSEEKKPEIINEVKQEEKNKVYKEKPQESISISNVVAPVVIAKQPIVIRTFKKPIWG